jgi:hypothetical protein
VTRGALARRAAVAVLAVLQIALVVRAYGADQAVFGFQMFPESSTWRAEIVRVTADGDEIDVRDPWPGGYTWAGLVGGRGLEAPFDDHHAMAGVDSTLDFLQKALDYVANHIPEDPETVRLVARVTYRRNGGDPETTVLTSRDRRPVP